jgi:ABC-2 type transport system ATP-binding protein
MSAISVKGLTRSYGSIKAVDGLELDVEEGQIFGLLGPNGCGKTTTIKMLLGLVRPDSGTATVLGMPAGSRGALDAVGYMPQETALYEELTVRENIALFAGFRGITGKDRLRREDEVLGLVDLRSRRSSVLSTLSGGQRHRVSLAVSMVHSPKVLFLDEPTVGVDPPLRANFWRTFRKKADEGMTIVMTTHYMDEARNCDRIAMMREGRLIAQGAPSSIIEGTGTTTLEEAFLELSKGGVVQ